jgi:hypothetical protein
VLEALDPAKYPLPQPYPWKGKCAGQRSLQIPRRKGPPAVVARQLDVFHFITEHKASSFL